MAETLITRNGSHVWPTTNFERPCPFSGAGGSVAPRRWFDDARIPSCTVTCPPRYPLRSESPRTKSVPVYSPAPPGSIACITRSSSACGQLQVCGGICAQGTVLPSWRTSQWLTGPLMFPSADEIQPCTTANVAEQSAHTSLICSSGDDCVLAGASRVNLFVWERASAKPTTTLPTDPALASPGHHPSSTART